MAPAVAASVTAAATSLMLEARLSDKHSPVEYMLHARIAKQDCLSTSNAASPMQVLMQVCSHDSKRQREYALKDALLAIGKYVLHLHVRIRMQMWQSTLQCLSPLLVMVMVAVMLPS